MKALIFLIITAAVVSALVWRIRKSEAGAALERRKAMERKRKQRKEDLAQDVEMIWPVIIRPVKGDQTSGADAKAKEPSMTEIEYEPPEKMASRAAGAGAVSGEAID